MINIKTVNARTFYNDLGYSKNSYARWCKLNIQDKFIQGKDYTKHKNKIKGNLTYEYHITEDVIDYIQENLKRYHPNKGHLIKLDQVNMNDSSIEYVEYEEFDRVIYIKEYHTQSEMIPDPIELDENVTLHHKDDMYIYRDTIYGDVLNEEDKPPYDEYEEIK